jgi:hypothetical protein
MHTVVVEVDIEVTVVPQVFEALKISGGRR